MSLFEQKYTEEDIAESPEAAVAPEGYYSVVLKGVKTGTTQATQGRVDLMFAPLREPGKLSSVDASLELNLMLLIDRWEDDDKFAASKRAKAAERKGILEEDVPASDVETAVQKAKSMAQFGAVKAMTALLGQEEYAEVPRFDPSAKAFFDTDGKSFTKEQKDAIYQGNVVKACNDLREIAIGEKDVTGYVCYAQVTHNTFNNRTNAQVRALYEDLPEGEETVPVAQWP